MYTYSELNDLLGNREEKKIRYATRVKRYGEGEIAIYHHATPIIIVNDKGEYYINTRGYHSRTTKDRINDYSPIGIYQKNFEWFVVDKENGDYPFIDGMTFDQWGEKL